MEKPERLDGPHSAYGYQWRKHRAEVYKQLDKNTGKIVAIKKTICDLGVPNPYWFATLEVFILSIIKHHPNVIRLQGLTKWDGVVKFYLEYIECNLEQFVKPPCSPISPILRKEYLRQILSGINYCHSQRVMHRRLEPRFVMVDRDKETVKISEFGEAKTFGSSEKNNRLVDHNRGYRAPEIILGPQFYAASDVWAIGCIFAEMVRHKPLFHGRSPDEELLSIFSLLGKPAAGNWPELNGYFDCVNLFDSCVAKDLRSEPWGCFGIEDTGLDLLCRMLAINPKDRITAADALNHPYFKETTSDTKMLCKRKFEDMSGNVGSECGEAIST